MLSLKSTLIPRREITESKEGDNMRFMLPKNMPFRSKLTLSYLVLVLLPIIIVGFFSYNVSLEALKKHTRENIDLAAEQIKDNIVFKVDSIKSISDYIFSDINFQKTLSKKYSDYERVQYMEYIKAYTLPLTSLPVTKSHIYIYVDNAYIPRISDLSGDKDPAANRGLSIQGVEDIKLHGIDRDIEGLGKEIVWRQIGTDKSFNNISIIRKFYSLENVLQYGAEKSLMGYIRITVKLEDIIDSEQIRKNGENRYLIMVNNNNEIIYSNPGCTSEKLDELTKSKKFLKIENNIPGINSNILIIVPVKELEESAASVRLFSLLISLISIIIFTIVALFLSKHFSSKTSELVKFIKSFRDGEFNRRLDTTSKDELYQISSAVNDMAATIDNLIEEVYVTNLRKAKADLQVLQSQINPHFLYNSLSSISVLAQMGRIEGLNDMINSLVSFYRLTLSKGSFIITVEDELRQVRAYADIKKNQYKERLNISYNIDSKVLEYKTIKIILQPFVENALDHGMNKGGKINIRLSANLDGEKIIFKIIDDGIGIHPDLICQIFEHDENALGYGVRNVDDRIKLQYGAEYGVTIFSRLGIGTTVKIEIPATMD